jgi:WD40 repeat protein
MNTTNQPNIIEHARKSLNWTVQDVKWIPNSAQFVAIGSYARGTGTVQIYKLAFGDNNNSGIEKTLEIPEQSCGLKCGTFDFNLSMDDCSQIACADIEGNLHVFDLNKGGSKVFSITGAHKSLINQIDGAGISGKGSPEIITAGRDGAVKIWDIRQRDKPVVSLEPDEGEVTRDCWACCFGNSYNDVDRVAVAGYDNGDLKIFDLRMNTMRWETNIKNGVCSVQFDRPDIEMNKLLATTLEGRFFIFDMRTFNAESGYAYMEHKEQNATVWCGKHLPQNRELFVTTGGSGSVYLYKYSYPPQRSVGNPPKGVAGTVTLLSKTSLSSQPIPSFDWHREKTGLAVMASFDQSIRVAIVTKLNKY